MENYFNYDGLLLYISDIAVLESSLYEQNLLYKKLNNQVNSLKQNTDKPYYNLKHYDSDSFYGLFGGSLWGAAIGFFLSFFTGNFISTVLICASIGFALGLILLIYDIISIHSENKEVEKQNSQIALMNHTQNAAKRHRIALIQKEMQKVQKHYNETRQTLNKIYDVNVIYDKYRSLPAMCTIYEYLYSKRCYQLEGPDGAYNIYENELRQNIIISKLDNIIDRLDIIAENQRMLHAEITKSNQIASRMNATIGTLAKKLDNVSGKLEDISEYEQVNAYYNKISARNTEYLKWSELINS